MRGSASSARANATSCRWPSESREPALAELGLVAVLEPHDEVVRADRLRGGDDLLVGRVGPAERDVLAHACRRRGSPPAGRRRAGGAATPGVTSRRSSPSIVIRPCGRVVEAGEQLGDRRLARAGVADERDRRARGDVEVDPVQHLVAAAVREAHALEADVAARSRARSPAPGRSTHLGLLVEDVGDLVERGGRREERAVELRELLDRVEEVLHVEHEGEEGADRQRARRSTGGRRSRARPRARSSRAGRRTGSRGRSGGRSAGSPGGSVR